ncbi:MAG: hypothetical protein KTR24_13250 [Saprospiraceae bacterium]|nr:hypothetical protein [Saprospiraceae bacterium]
MKNRKMPRSFYEAGIKTKAGLAGCCLLVLNLVIAGCGKEAATEDVGVVGVWELVEVLADPGDGSGTFQPAQSDRKMNFRVDNVVESDVSFCRGTVTDPPFEANYSSSSLTIEPVGCAGSLPIRYELSGRDLIISYTCIEPCREKYRRASDQ